MNESAAPASSPFHAGERAIQTRLGVRDSMEAFGSRVIRDHMPEQHRDFYAKLPFVFVGYADELGRPWASVLFGEPGFLTSPDPAVLDIEATPLPHDPLADHLQTGARIGVLGIELQTRRRNRLSASVEHVGDRLIRLSVDQAFGNCPQYIQVRAHTPRPRRGTPTASESTALDTRARRLIETADTFFVASVQPGAEVSAGADVSHRGGRPGFVRIDDDHTLTIPDYLGNSHYNTLGNIYSNPRAGLLFLDFDTGDVLALTGAAEILWDEDLASFAGAERAWRFVIESARYVSDVLPLTWSTSEYSPNTLLTGDWERAAAIDAAARQRDAWRDAVVTSVHDENPVVRSVVLTPVDHAIVPFLPGQYLTISLPGREDVIRTYTVSSAPSDEGYRISVKREQAAGQPPGRGSSHIHDALAVGDVIRIRAPRGDFHLDTGATRPALLLAGGIGVTPMVAMARQALLDGVRTRSPRPLTIIQSDHDVAGRAFHDELRQIAAASNGTIRHFSTLTNATGAGTGEHQFQGRIDRALLQRVLSIDDYEVFVCGPAGFMQAMYDALRGLGVADDAIRAEAFGPAGLRRDGADEALPEADGAVVRFTRSGTEHVWTPTDGTLLDLAEAHGLTPPFGCRSGACGACATDLSAGDVTYRSPPRADAGEGEVLICCAVPAASDTQDAVEIAL